MGKAVAKSIGALDRRQLAVIDQLALDFEQAWKQGKLPRIEAFLRRPEVDPSIQGLLFDELLTIEMEYRVRRSQTPDLAKYQARFPHLAERVEAVFDYVCPSILQRAPGHNSDNSRGDAVFAGDAKCPADGGPAESRSTRDDRPLPKHVGRYAILRLIAEGGFGRVMLAKDAELNRLVAVKVSRQGLFTGEHDVSRFLEEARMAAQLKHPNIVSIHDAGRDGDLGCFIVMDFIDGGPLDVEDAAARMSYDEVASLIAQIADAVHYAHTKGLVHRDLKPGNILLDNRGMPYVADFGLAVHESVQQDYAGEISGTPPYMSPEQVRGLTHRMDGRTDIWSLGILLYELLTGRRPFAGQTRAKVFDEVLNRDPKPLRQINDAIPVDLECICLKALRKQPSDRYSTALDLAESLRRAIANSAEGLLVTPPVPPPVAATIVSTRRWSRLVWPSSAVAGILLLAVVMFFPIAWHWLFGPPSPSPPPSPQPEIHAIASLLNAHPDGCNLVALSPISKLVAAADRSGTVRLFAALPPKLVHEFPHGQPISDLCLSRDGELLAVMCVDDPRIYLYETRPPFRPIVTTVAGEQQARFVPSPNNDHEIWLARFGAVELRCQDVTTGAVTRQFQDGPWEAAQLAVSHSQLVVGGYDVNRGRWRIAFNRQLAPAMTDVGPICSVAVSQDGTHLVYCGYGQDGGIQLTDGVRQTIVALPKLAAPPLQYRQAAFSEDGRRLVTVCWRADKTLDAQDSAPFGHLCVWDIAGLSQPLARHDFAQPIDAVVIAPPLVCLTTGHAWELLEIVDMVAHPLSAH
ncbi:MAG: WD40 repeat domain-containing serine/threonine protein kinase [Pirellulaceae bacterium]